ncbi:hypothetical protein ACQP2F_02175 [Actinoplanes sp. CA-030573]|uniref:hypothetical protein n=1 Tax=Actinoplanes sp. CA-030573 TaxID=3239898 RepID=UPI003D8B0CC6
MIRLIGGEMPGFTESRPPAGGGLLGHIADQVPAGVEVLVAGPHDRALIDTVKTRSSVTCLVRSQTAAAELDARGLDVLCGSLTKLEAGRWDVIVAFDGVDRLCSVEGPQLDWAESVQALKRSLRPGGTLLLAVENSLGVHRLVDPGIPTAAQTDDAWRPLGEFDGSRPGTPARLTARFEAEGLTVGWLAAAWPEPGSPTLAATAEALENEALAALAARAAGVAYANRSVLSDPRRLAAAAVRAGLGAELAASWLVVAHLAPSESPAVTSLPPVLTEAGPLDRPLPQGHLVEELLLAACLRHDLPTVRRLLTGWIAALPGATADNVVVDGDTYTMLDPSVPAEADVLHRFARTLLTGGYAHPWPAATDPQALTAILHGAAGLSGDVPAAPDGDDPPLPDARREHEEQLRALNRRLADAESRADMSERELAKREEELRKARAQIATFSGSIGYRMAKLGYGAARKARNRLRKRT